MHLRVVPVLTSMVLALSSALVMTTSQPASAAVSVFPVPTSSAGLGRITTAPNGNMWFVMRDANKVGRITPSGIISEFALPPTTTGDGWVMDLDVGADGTVWVVYDSGWHAIALNGDGQAVTPPISLGAYPYGEEVRVDPSGIPWVTMGYDDNGIARIVGNDYIWYDNAPPCDATLAEARDGSMWCQQFDKVIHVNADGSGGVTYPLPSDASYPYSLAPGPVGSIWFGRHSGGTIFTSPSRGSVGWVDQSTGATTIWNTGDRTAPSSLVQGPDGNMWFTSIGADDAIGHISPAGRGAITKVGNYRPRTMTFGVDGAVWFADRESNAIVRVTTDELQTTNIDPGEGSVLVDNPTTPPAPVQAGALVTGKKPVKVKKLKLPVTVSCPATATSGCSGKAVVRTAKKVVKPGSSKGKKLRRVVSRTVSYSLTAGQRQTLKLKLTSPGKRLVPQGTIVKLRAELTTAGAKKPSVTATFRARR
jgi:virginiamycin B lyase